jgi:protease-4
MKRLLIVLLSVLGGIVFLLAAGLLLFWMARAVARPGVSGKTVLEVDFESGMIEYVPDDPFAAYSLKGTSTVLDRVLALRRAASDDRVVGLLARVGAGGMGMAQTQEMRDAVLAFRESGKFAVAYSETLGEMGPGNGGYYLATAFDEIFLQPTGDLGLTGIALEHPFVRGTLDKLGIVPRMDHRYEYKNAMNFYTETSFTEPHREAMARMIESWFGQMVDGIAEARGLTPEEVRGLVDRGPFLGQEALAEGLVDELLYRDEVYDRVKERAGGDPDFLSLSAYQERSGTDGGWGPNIALIYAVGAIHRGNNGYDPLSGEVSMGSDSVARAIRSAVEDDSVRAILLRVDSPGGSFVASDTIWREVRNAEEAGTPVVISMGNAAASGGYYIAMGAKRIIAQPGTLTGSIGVLAGKMLTRDAWNKIGLTWDSVQTSRNADIWSSLEDYTPEQWDRFEASLDRIYDEFTRKVAASREMPLEEVQEVARGRVWTGEDALDRGLVDALGGFDDAIAMAKEAAGIEPDGSVRLKRFPKERSTFELLMEAFEGARTTQSVVLELMERIQPAAREVQQVTLGPARYGVLTMPPIEETP